MIIFEKVVGKNFLSFEEFELNFTEGKHLILGTNHSTDYAESNGSGKSSLLRQSLGVSTKNQSGARTYLETVKVSVR